MNRPAPPWGISAFPKKKTNAPGEGGMGTLGILTKQKVKMAGYWPSSPSVFIDRVEANRQPS